VRENRMHGIDEGGLETGPSATAPVLYSTESLNAQSQITDYTPSVVSERLFCVLL